MIFGLIKIGVWLIGLGVIVSWALPFFGYEINFKYFRESRPRCEAQLQQCRAELIRTGIEGAKDRCDWKCVDPKLFLKTNVKTDAVE